MFTITNLAGVFFNAEGTQHHRSDEHGLSGFVISGTILVAINVDGCFKKYRRNGITIYEND